MMRLPVSLLGCLCLFVCSIVCLFVCLLFVSWLVGGFVCFSLSLLLSLPVCFAFLVVLFAPVSLFWYFSSFSRAVISFGPAMRPF